MTTRRTSKFKGPRPTPRPPRKVRTDVTKAVPSSEGSARIALLAAEAALDKKAFAVEIVDVTGKVDYADFLVLMTGSSDRHVAAIADAVDELLARHGHRSISIEGRGQASWVLIDFVDIVVHVFQHDSRAVYDLDGLWLDAQRLPVPGIPAEES